MRGFAKLTWVEFKLFLRDPVSALFSIPFPPMLLLLFGLVYGNHPTPIFGGTFGNVDVFVPGFAAMVIAGTAFLALGIGVASYRETGVLRRLSVTSVSPLAILASQLAVALAGCTLGLLLTIAVAAVGFGLRFEGNPFNVAAAFALSCLSLGSLGFVLSGLVPTARSAWTAGAAITFPMIFLSGAVLPRELLPENVRTVSQGLPLTPVVTLMRGMWAGDIWSMHLGEVGVLTAILAACVLLSARTFRWR
jgi:ABC-2 type transport system permease protein